MKKIWTREKILVALHAWKTEHGSYPGRGQWRWRGEHHPSDNTVIYAFGSWEAALETAKKARIPRPRPSRDGIIALMKAWEAEHGIAPVANDWQWDKSYPAPNWVKNQFGSWNAGIEAAGYFPRTRGITKKALARYTPLPRRRKDDHANQGSAEEA